jgi:S1-C subfamily serine protease
MDIREMPASVVFASGWRAASAVLALLAVSCTPMTAAERSPEALPELIPRLLPHVVNITFSNIKQQASGQLTQSGKGLGSGYVVDARGIIVTNRHVTDGGNEYFVTFSNGSQLKARLVYRSPDIDLALLQVFPDAPLLPVRWGNSDRLLQGDAVIAIGNPLGLAGTVTTGVGALQMARAW